MSLKSSLFSKAMNEAMFQSASRTGMDMVAIGAGVGGGVGAVTGMFSDYDTTIGGGIRGAMMGAVSGVGAKFVGTRYARGYLHNMKAAGIDISKDINAKSGYSEDVLNDFLKVKAGNFNHAKNKGAPWFDVEIPNALKLHKDLVNM